MCVPTHFKLEFSDCDKPPRPVKRQVSEDVTIIEIEPGRMVRTPRRKGKRPVRDDDDISISIGLPDRWLCPSCKNFIDIRISTCHSCGHHKYGRPSPKPDPKPESKCEPIDYHKLKELMIDVGKEVAKDAIGASKPPPTPAPPPPTPKAPPPIVIGIPERSHSCRPSHRHGSVSSSHSAASRSSLRRVKEHVHGLRNKVYELSDRFHVLGGRVEVNGQRVSNLNNHAQAVDGEVRGLGLRVDAVEGRELRRDIRDEIRRAGQDKDHRRHSHSRSRSRGRSSDRHWWDERDRDRRRERERERDREREVERLREQERRRRREMDRDRDGESSRFPYLHPLVREVRW